MRITTLIVPVVLSLVGAGALQAQGASPAAGGNPAPPAPRLGNGPAGPLANVSKSLPRRKDVLVDQKEQLIAASRASVRRVRSAQQQSK
jgi:hypothetical protein